MKVFMLLFLFVGLLDLDCSSPKTNELKSPVDSSEITKNNVELKTKFPEINFPELLTLNPKELRIIRNSIFAKYGRAFKSDDLRAYFENQPWYKVNDNFSTDLLSESDLLTIQLIVHLEKDENILWKSISNMDGKGNDELCLLVEKSDHSEAIIFINDKKIELHNNWFEKTKTYGKSLSPNWSNLSVKIIDINKSDNSKELMVSQKYFEWEDPGLENIIVTKYNGLVKSYTLGSNAYNSGKLTLSENEIILNVSHCPTHTQTYSVRNGKINMTSEIIGEMPKNGCPACFVGDSMVLIEGGFQKKISKLRAGDVVISYNTKTGVNTETIIEEIVAVHHSSLIELIFEHDTIISTKDHPYYTVDKGWCSFNTTATENRYSNYKSVDTILLGDDFIRSNGSTTKLLKINNIEKEQITYTITKLKEGDAFYVNDILVGVEEIRSSL